MYLAYSLFLTLGLLVLLPRFLFQALIHGKYVSGFRERLGSIPVIEDREGPVIWLHCVSVGETQAVRPLVNQLRADFPHCPLVISTITLTGQRLAREVFRDQALHVFYFPFDWRWSVRRSLRKINPAAVLIMETELWPNFMRECKRQQIPVALVNGRISRQSFRRYRSIRFLFKHVLFALNVAAMQSEADAERIRGLGLRPEKVFVTGNLKFDAGQILSTREATTEIQSRFHLGDGVPLIVAASTHAPEEKIMLEAFRTVRRAGKARLLLAPRHPERFQEVASLIQSSSSSWARRTNAQAEADKTAEVILLDTIGELPATYSFADIVFVGGSIVDRGGHNLLEPAAAGACIVTGANTHNFHAIVDVLSEGDALFQLPPLDPAHAAVEVDKVFSELLRNPECRRLMGERAKIIFRDNQGATVRTMALISPLFADSIEMDHAYKSRVRAHVSA